MASTKTKNKSTSKSSTSKKKYSKKKKQEILDDYKLAVTSREASYLGRKETLTGKAKFGIFGDGKEIPQIAMAKYFKEGDFRAGYYRDQTFMMAIGQVTVQQFFAQLYAHANIEADPHSGGRQMNAHFSTRSLDEKGKWKDLTKMNSINFQKMAMKLHGEPSAMPVLLKEYSGRQLMLPALCRCQWSCRYGTTVTAYQFQENTRPPKKAFPRYLKDFNVPKSRKAGKYLP